MVATPPSVSVTLELSGARPDYFFSANRPGGAEGRLARLVFVCASRTLAQRAVRSQEHCLRRFGMRHQVRDGACLRFNSDFGVAR